MLSLNFQYFPHLSPQYSLSIIILEIFVVSLLIQFVNPAAGLKMGFLSTSTTSTVFKYSAPQTSIVNAALNFHLKSARVKIGLDPLFQWFSKFKQAIARLSQLKCNVILNQGTFSNYKFMQNWREEFTDNYQNAPTFSRG